MGVVDNVAFDMSLVAEYGETRLLLRKTFVTIEHDGHVSKKLIEERRFSLKEVMWKMWGTDE